MAIHTIYGKVPSKSNLYEIITVKGAGGKFYASLANTTYPDFYRNKLLNAINYIQYVENYIKYVYTCWVVLCIVD
jgi:hypothetical protein